MSAQKNTEAAQYLSLETATCIRGMRYRYCQSIYLKRVDQCGKVVSTNMILRPVNRLVVTYSLRLLLISRITAHVTQLPAGAWRIGVTVVAIETGIGHHGIGGCYPYNGFPGVFCFFGENSLGVLYQIIPSTSVVIKVAVRFPYIFCRSGFAPGDVSSPRY